MLNVIDLSKLVDNDSIWDDEENLDRLVKQWPMVSRINICAFTKKKMMNH